MSNRLVKYVQDFLDSEVDALAKSRAKANNSEQCQRFDACRRQLRQYLDQPSLPQHERALADKAWGYIEALERFDVAANNRSDKLEMTASILNESQRDLESMLYQYARYGTGNEDDLRRRILVAVDDQAASDWALQTAIDLAKALSGRLMLMHVVPSAVGNICDSGCYDATRTDFFRQRGDALLNQKRGVVPSGICCGTILREGNVADEILKAARRWGADYIVMGTHGRSRLARFILGSVAEGVIRQSFCPVVAVGHEHHAANTVLGSFGSARNTEVAAN